MNETNTPAVSNGKNNAARPLAEKIITVLHTKGAGDIKLLHVEKSTIIADYYVLCTGNSRTHIQALADEVAFQLSQAGIVPHHSDGKNTEEWIVLDFGSVILHVFSRSAREFYKLEKLWSDAADIDISHLQPGQLSG